MSSLLKGILYLIFGPHTFEVLAFFFTAMGVAFALASEKADIVRAHYLFAAAALLSLGRVVHLLLTWKSESLLYRYAAAFFLIGAVGALWLITFDWIQNKLEHLETGSRPASQATAEQPATIIFKHTALNFYQSFGSTFVADKPVGMHVVYENAGDGSATAVKADGVLRFIDYDPSETNLYGLMERETEAWNKFRADWVNNLDHTLGIDLAAHATDHFRLNTEPLSPDQVVALKVEKQLVYFLGAIKWTDATGDYETDLCSFFRPSVKYSEALPAAWHDCLSGRSATRKVFQTEMPPERVRRLASVNVEVLPTIDLKSELAYYVVRLTNTGALPARNLNSITLPKIFPSGMHRLKVDQEFVEFEQWVKVHGEFGENTLGVNQVAQERVQLTSISMQDMLDIEAGAKVLYIFMIVKYKDDKHPEGLESKSCTTYRRGIIEACDGHNEVP